MAEISHEGYEYGRENTAQQLRSGTADQAMNETSHKQKFQRHIQRQKRENMGHLHVRSKSI